MTALRKIKNKKKKQKTLRFEAGGFTAAWTVLATVWRVCVELCVCVSMHKFIFYECLMCVRVRACVCVCVFACTRLNV